MVVAAQVQKTVASWLWDPVDFHYAGHWGFFLKIWLFSRTFSFGGFGFLWPYGSLFSFPSDALFLPCPMFLWCDLFFFFFWKSFSDSKEDS